MVEGRRVCGEGRRVWGDGACLYAEGESENTGKRWNHWRSQFWKVLGNRMLDPGGRLFLVKDNIIFQPPLAEFQLVSYSQISSSLALTTIPWNECNYSHFKFIYLFIFGVLGLHFCARPFSSCGERGPLFIAVRRPLTVAASPVAEHRLQTRRLSSCGTRA